MYLHLFLVGMDKLEEGKQVRQMFRVFNSVWRLMSTPSHTESFKVVNPSTYFSKRMLARIVTCHAVLRTSLVTRRVDGPKCLGTGVGAVRMWGV